MVFAVKKVNNTFIDKPRDRIVAGKTIDSFIGHYSENSVNLLNMPLGQLLYCKNMEFFSSNGKVFLKTRRGSTLHLDITNAVLGAGDLVIGSDNKFIWVDITGALNYYDDASIGVVASSPTMDIVYYYDFFMFGLIGDESLFGINQVQGLFKVDSLTPTYTSIKQQVTGSDILGSCFGFSNIGGRLFIANGHRVDYSAIQQRDAIDTSNLEFFEDDTFLFVEPDEGTGINRIVDNGEITFFFKDTGIWALINASEAVTDWFIPKCNADTGTMSPWTVKYGRYGLQPGFIYLGSDKTLRFFNGRVERNAGKIPTLTGGDSIIISEPFQDILNNIPDGYLKDCKATYIERYYILNIVSNSGSAIDTTIIIDTDKLIQGRNNPQPYWFIVDNFNYTDYVMRNNSLYGFNIDGYINQVLVPNKINDEVPSRISVYADDEIFDSVKNVSIQWAWYLGWSKISNEEVQFYDGYLHWQSITDKPITITVNSFKLGDNIPSFDSGITNTLYPQVSGINSYFDSAIWDINAWAGSDATLQMSQNMNMQTRGNYFLFGAYATGIYTAATFYSLEPRFKTSKNNPVGSRP